MPDMPTGTVTFLFSDIEGSTAHWERGQERMRAALARHDAIMGQAIAGQGGFIFKALGDAFCAAFATAPAALEAAVEAQRQLAADPEPGASPLRVRIALHSGAVEQRDGDYFGSPLNRVARLLAAGHGGQSLLSMATTELVRDALPPAVELRDLGLHRLRDLTRPEHIFQIQAAGLPDDFPPLRTLDSHPHNLPTQATPLIGREREVAAVVERLLRSDVRLVTLTGPGGIGKTRLGLQVAAELLDAFADGVFFVVLASIRDPQLALSSLAQVFAIAEAGGDPPLDRLAAYLRDRHLLLLIDNFEQVLAAASALSALLEAAPQLKILVTSRAVLGVYGEYDFAVPPLLCPDASRPLPPEALTQYEAVRLFIARAQAAQADFCVTSDNAPAIAEICYRLDGLPLAIELAAARVRLLPPPALLARLGQRLKVLTGGARNLPARQQTLRNTIDWSYDLLDDAERALFARLAIFVGGCTLAGAEAVCGAAASPGPDLLDGIQSILDKSLIYQAPGEDAEPRFLMLETIREYALERLEQRGEAAALRRAHAAHFLGLVQQAQPEFFGPGQNLWFARIEAELDNLRAALEWSKNDPAGAAIGLQIAGLLWRFWRVRGHIAEGRAWLAGLLERRQGLAPSDIWYALHTAGNLSYDLGDLQQAQRYWEECLAICRELGNTKLVGHMLNNLGNVATAQAAYDLAAARYADALTIYREQSNLWGVGLATSNLAGVAHRRGDYQQARQLFQQSLGVMRELGDSEEVARMIEGLGRTALEQEDDGAAEHHFDEAERILRAVGSRPGLASVLCARGAVTRRRGDYPAAIALLEQSLALQRELGDRHGVAGVLYERGRVAHEQGEPAVARAHYAESLRIRHERGDRQGVAALLEACAALEYTGQSWPQAAWLAGAAAALRDLIGAPLAPRERAGHARLLADLRAAQGQAAFDAAWRAGQAAPLDAAVAMALGEATPEPAATAGARPRDLDELTPREIDVLRLVAQGLTDAEVGQALVISPRTVNGHLSSIYSKLGVSSRTAAARLALDRRLI